MKYFSFFKIQCTMTQICNTSRSNTRVMTWKQLSVLLKNPPKGDTIFLQNIGMTETRIVERICRVISPSFIPFKKNYGESASVQSKGRKTCRWKNLQSKVSVFFRQCDRISFPPFCNLTFAPFNKTKSGSQENISEKIWCGRWEQGECMVIRIIAQDNKNLQHFQVLFKWQHQTSPTFNIIRKIL